LSQLAKEALALCHAIEALPASEQQTAISIKASALHSRLVKELQQLHQVAITTDKLLDVMNEFPDDHSTYDEYMDAVDNALTALGEGLAEMKYGTSTA
jgi:hypothetical protein